MAYDPIRDEMSIVKRVAQLKQQGTPMVAPGGYDPNLNTLRNTVGSVSSWITQGDPKGNLALPQFSQWEAPVRQAMQEAQSGTLEQQFSAGPRFTPPPTPAPTPTPVAPQPTAQIAQPQAPQQPQFQQGGTIVGIGAPQYGQTQQPAPPAPPAQTQWSFNREAGRWEPMGQQQAAPVAPVAPVTPPVTPPTQPISQTSSYEEELRRLQEASAGQAKTPEQIESEKRLNDYLAQLDALEAQKRTEQARAGLEPVAMPFITGRQEAIERMASTRAGEIGAKAAPLQRQLAQMQTERESQRQAALDISKIRLERIQEQEKQALEKQKFEREQAFKEKELPMKYQPDQAKAPTLQGSAEAGYYQYDTNTGNWKQVIAPQIKEAAKPASFQEYEYAKKEGFKGTYNDYQTMDANRKRSISNTTNIIGDSGLTGKQADLFSGVVKQYNSSPLIAASDRTPVLKGAIAEIRKDPTNGTKQLNLVYSYIQALDTYQSAVREGELGLVNSIDSRIGKLSNAVQQIQNGQIVRGDVAKEIASAAESIVNTISSAAAAKSKSFDSQANTLGVGAAWNKYKEGFTPSFVAPKETTKSTPLWGPGVKQPQTSGTTSSGIKYTIE